MWNRWLPTTEREVGASFEEIVTVQQKLIDRIYREGYAYMTVRAMRLEEMPRATDSVAVFDAEQDSDGGWDRHGRRPPAFVEEEEDARVEEIELADFIMGNDISDGEHSNQEDLTASSQRYLHDFALPGPTVAMSDTVLDTIACSAATTAADAQDVLDTANYLHDTVMLRHVIDGGDTINTNPHTRPTAVTFNALLRVAAELPYAASSSRIEFRDDAVTTFITTLQAMHECGVVHRNSACYTYALYSVAKYMPASRIRGNIAAGIFHQARYYGLVNDSVVEAYRAANTPSNEDSYDDFIRDKLLPGQWPGKWKRDSRKLQFHPREDTY